MSTAIITTNKFYKPSIFIEEFIQLHFSNIHISLYPSKLINYEKFLINDISKFLKINNKIIRNIYNNLSMDIFNGHYITNELNYYLTFTTINTWYSPQTIKFSNKTLQYINNFLSKRTLSSFRYDYESSPSSKNNQYFIFIHTYLNYHIFKIKELIHCINRNINKIININKKLNKTVNYISYLNQSENLNTINNFLRKRISSYEANNVIIKFFPEIKELDLQYNEAMGIIFSRFDYKNIIYNLYGDKYGLKFIKNDSIRFIDYLLRLNKIDIKILEEKNKIINLCTSKDYNFKRIEEIVQEFKNIMDKMSNYDLNLYSHRQKIINDNFHYIRNLYNEISNICSSDTIQIINTLLISDEKYRINNVISFLLKIANTDTHKLIYL